MLDTDVTFAVLAAAALHAGWNATIKRSGDPLFETTAIHGWAAFAAIALIPFVAPPGEFTLACLMASAAVHCVYYHALATAYRSGDLSLAYPVMRGSAPTITAVASGLLLHEWPSGPGWMGIVLVCTGVLGIGLAGHRVSTDRAARRRTLRWALLTGMTIVIYTLIDSTGVRSAVTPLSYIAWLALVQGLVLVPVVLARHGRALLQHAQTRGLQPLWAGTASWVAYGIALWAVTRAPVASVAALRESSVVFALLIAAVLLKERVGIWRWAGAVAIVAGVVLLRLA